MVSFTPPFLSPPSGDPFALPAWKRCTFYISQKITSCSGIIKNNILGILYDKVEMAAVGFVYGDSCSGQEAMAELGLTGIPIFNVRFIFQFLVNR